MKLCYSCMQQIENNKLHTCPHCGEPLAVGDIPSRFLHPGTVLQGKFIVGKAIGSGGFGNTYIGWNQLLLCKVAIKEFYPAHICMRQPDSALVGVREERMLPNFQAGLRQFLEEARSVANLQDIKGVVSIYTFFEANGTGYIVMEYLEGMDVKAILKRSGDKKDYRWSRRVILTVLHTLRDIHKRGVLHRDIAPDNIFVTKEGVIKLIDFGAAKHASELANVQAEVVLKQGYAPIEQYSRSAPQGPYTDLYAVAALFYRMLTGMKPLPAIERLEQDGLIPPSQIGVELPEQAEMAIMCCLNIQPQYRLQSADDFMEALDGANFIPVYEPKWILPPAPPERGIFFRKIAGLSVGIKVLLILLVLGLLGGSSAGIYFLTRQEKSQQVASDQQILVPNCEGQTKEEAEALLNEEGLTVSDNPVYEYSSTVSEGTVMGQSVSAGTRLTGEEEIQLTVSGGTHQFTVADCSGMSRQEAEDFFRSKGVEVQVEEDYSEEQKKDALVSQTAGQGELFVIGESATPVVLVYSLGKRSDYERKMPDLSGMSIGKAKKKLKDKKITIKVETKKDSSYSSTPKGKVSRQSPKKGATVNIREDKKVTLYTSKGPKPTPKPTQRPVATSVPRPEHDAGVSMGSIDFEY